MQTLRISPYVRIMPNTYVLRILRLWIYSIDEVAYLISFHLLRTKIYVVNTFGEQFMVEERLK